MHFTVDPEIFAKYPDLHVGILVCRGVKNGQAVDEVTGLLRDAERGVRAKFADPEQIKEHPTIAAWQEVHRSFGSNPNKFPSSIHALLKRVAKGGELPKINTLVDVYNIVSLKHVLPVGGEDLDRCKGDIVLTLADGREPFVALGSLEHEVPDPGEVIYRDEESVLCRKFNWRESARTCLTEQTTNAVLVIEAVPPVTREALEAALMELQNLVMMFAGGTIRNSVLSAAEPSVEC